MASIKYGEKKLKYIAWITLKCERPEKWEKKWQVGMPKKAKEKR